MPSLSESMSTKLAMPSLSVSRGVWPSVSFAPVVSASVMPATSSKPSLSVSVNPSRIPLLSLSTILASAPLSTRSLMPSLSESKSSESMMPSLSVSVISLVKTENCVELPDELLGLPTVVLLTLTPVKVPKLVNEYSMAVAALVLLDAVIVTVSPSALIVMLPPVPIIVSLSICHSKLADAPTASKTKESRLELKLPSTAPNKAPAASSIPVG